MITFRSSSNKTILGLILILSGSLLLAPSVSPANEGLTLLSEGKPEHYPSLAPMIKRVAPAVVNISIRGSVSRRFNPLLNDPFFRHFFNLPERQLRREFQAAGSGVIIDTANGYILTNHHVIKNARDVNVTLRDGRALAAQVIGADPDTDVAVIQVPSENLVALPIGDSRNTEVGDFVVAIGNPFGLGQTVTSGIVSAIGRSGLGLEGYEDFIQTDASINPGNSGGALVNLKGKIIGINTAIVAPGGGNVGIGFAIPIHMAHAIMGQLIRHGEVRRGKLGIQVQDITPDLAQALNLKSSLGAIISRVNQNSTAEAGGLKAGDVVIAIDGMPVRNSSSLRNHIGLIEAGTVIVVTVIRDGLKIDLKVSIRSPYVDTRNLGEIDTRFNGAEMAIVDESTPLFGQVTGLVITRIKKGSRAWNVGLRKGDVLSEVNRKRINNLEDLEEALKAPRHLGLMLNIRRGSGEMFIFIQ